MLATPVPGLTTRSGSWRSASSEPNWPPTRTCRFWLPASSTPALSTAFCAPICAITVFRSRPSWARRWPESSMKTFSGCAPKTSTLATSLTCSSSARVRSANSRSSSRLKPSADSAKIEP